MDICRFWDDNYFHILYDDSTPPFVEHIMAKNHEPSLLTIFQYSLVLVCYAEDFFGYGGIYIFKST
jgi:hypothetical protein